MLKSVAYYQRQHRTLAAAQLHVLDPVKTSSLAMNLTGACLVILSLTKAFNLSAFLMEAAWALIAAAGLLRAAMTSAPVPSTEGSGTVARGG